MRVPHFFFLSFFLLFFIGNGLSDDPVINRWPLHLQREQSGQDDVL